MTHVIGEGVVEMAPRPFQTRLAYDLQSASDATDPSRATLFRRIQDGALRPVLVGGKHLILHDDLMAFLTGAAGRK
jgi:hypothetical protein